MNNEELINLIFKLVLLPLLGILVNYISDFLKAKRDELKATTDNEIAHKYIDMVTNTVTQCVIATNQTYVDSLKQAGSFDEAAQKAAFRRTFNDVISILSDEAKTYIKEITGDLDTYLIAMIEAEVAKNKA